MSEELESMKRRFRCPNETKKELVVEVLSGYRTEIVARKHGMSPRTLSQWVRQYQDEVGDLMKKKQNDAEKMKQDAANFKELEKKYNDAMKLLGEKELENSILRDLVKKKYPDWK
ncbi:transposase [Paenibacillus ihumii]|jgi:transposase-like protein|uniref:transposase n=1 Tax=Paenibacillus ihumii TaxID=687436 RepID=UPI001E5033B7|nr:transposase [Paenibacillus ihumii]